METKPRIRVAIVDDHELLRGGIRFALLMADDIEVVAEAHHGEDAVRICCEIQPDVVLMDMRLSGDMDGVAATVAVRAICPQTRVLGLSGQSDPGVIRKFLEAGAIGYVAKGTSAAALADAIRSSHQGRPTLSAESLAALIRPIPAADGYPWATLTSREREVLYQLAHGKTNAQIAEALVVSIAAVKYHVGNILSKLGLSNRTAAAAFAREHNLHVRRPQ